MSTSDVMINNKLSFQVMLPPGSRPYSIKSTVSADLLSILTCLSDRLAIFPIYPYSLLPHHY